MRLTLPPASDSTPIEAPVPEAIRTRGWRQGAALPPKLLAMAAAKLDITEYDTFIGIVITQDCDLVHSSFDAEPFAEVLLAQYAAKPDGNRRWAKNPRVIQFEAEDHYLDACIHHRCHLDRKLLCMHAPSRECVLDEENVRQLRSWLARRYKRAAFPDEFNRRLKPIETKLSKKLKAAHDFTGIYIIVPNVELAEGENYKLEVRATMLPSDFDDWGKQARYQGILDELVDLMNTANGVLVEDHHLLSEQDISLNDLRYLKRWDWDSLTLRKGTIPPPDEE